MSTGFRWTDVRRSADVHRADRLVYLDQPFGECSFLVTDRRVGTSVELAGVLNLTSEVGPLKEEEPVFVPTDRGSGSSCRAA